MGCDIHSIAEKRVDGKWMPIETDGRTTSWGLFFEKETEHLAPFNWRSYSMFAFLAGVRNYDHCEPISEPKGLPNDSEYLNHETEGMWGSKETEKQRIQENEYHSASWLTLKELIDFDYEKTFWNRRIYRPTYREDGTVSGGNGAALAEEGEGAIVSYKENLGEGFFKEIELLKTFGNPEDVRIVFWFDN